MPNLVLALKTDQPEAQVSLLKDGEIIGEVKWQAHKQLSDTLLKKIEEALEGNSLSWSDISGVIVFRGPGSFTGLRIGATVGNTLAYSNNIPVAGTNGESWIKDGLEELVTCPENRIVQLEYGGEANITKPRK